MSNWEKYRSAKWFQCAMEDCRAREATLSGPCPFCRIARIEMYTRAGTRAIGGDYECRFCIWDDGCSDDPCLGENGTTVATCESVWGDFA